MIPLSPDVPSREARRARAAVAAMFFTNGALFANLVPRYPEIKADLGLDDAAYGIAIAAFPTGAIVAGLAAAPIIRRLGSGRTAAVGTVLTAVGTMIAAFAPDIGALALALLVAGATDAITDVAQNTHGLRVQRRYGRSIINSFHAIWSVGAVVGGVMGATSIAIGLPRTTHLALSALVFAVVCLVALPHCLPGEDDEGSTGPGVTPRRRIRTPVVPRTVLLLAALVLIAVAGILVEDAGATWSAVYLSRDLGASASVAAYGFIALVGAQCVGRTIGDRLVDRLGQRTVARVGGACAALGMGAALAFPSVPGTILGFAAAGLGLATIVPAAMQRADEMPGLPVGTGVTLVSWLMRLGFLVSPPVVGLVADHLGLRAGLGVVPLAGVIALLLAAVLAPRRRPSGAVAGMRYAGHDPASERRRTEDPPD